MTSLVPCYPDGRPRGHPAIHYNFTFWRSRGQVAFAWGFESILTDSAYYENQPIEEENDDKT